MIHQASRKNLQLESLEKVQPVETLSNRGLASLTSAPAFALIPAVFSAAWLLPVPYSAWQLCAGVTFASVLMAVYMLIHEQRDEALSAQDADQIPLLSPATSWRVLAILTMMLLILPRTFLPTKFSELVALVIVALLKSLQWVMAMELVSLRHSARLHSLTAWTGAQKIPDPPDYNIDVCFQHHTNIPFASYNGKSWIGC